MQFKDWTTLKTAGKVAFKKIAEVAEVKDSDGNITTHYKPSYIALEKKSYNSDTGVEYTKYIEMSLSQLESAKTIKTAEKTALTTEITEIGKMITQIKKV